jgi:hypothetical protein
MTEPNEKKYKQLGLFSIIVAEVVVTPCALGGLAYWLTKGHSSQMLFASVAAFVGLGVAIYRIFQLYKIQSRDDSNE